MENIKYSISPEQEFWGHCSNLQMWYEHNYDTRIFRSNLAFPLLRELTEYGDPRAKKVFKEEIAKRIESGFLNVIFYLFNEGYLYAFNKNDIITSNYFKILDTITIQENDEKIVAAKYEIFLSLIKLIKELNFLHEFLEEKEVIAKYYVVRFRLSLKPHIRFCRSHGRFCRIPLIMLLPVQ